MKSGPTLNGWTTRPILRSACISPRDTVVFPHPLWVPATMILGMAGGFLRPGGMLHEW
jgi:hypothetical protein